VPASEHGWDPHSLISEDITQIVRNTHWLYRVTYWIQFC